MHPDWVRSLRGQCQDAGVPFFFKGNGEWSLPEVIGNLDGIDLVAIPTHSRKVLCQGETMIRVGKKRAGRLLDGVEHNAFPEA